MANPEGSFIWYELMTPDPDASKVFYDAVVGWDVDAASTGPQGTDYRMIKRSDGGNAGGMLKLDQAMIEHGARPMWLGYVNVGDVDAAVAKAGERGAAPLIPPFDAPGVGRIAMIADPQGAPLYLMKPNPPAGQPDAGSDVFSVDQPGRINWNELSTSDSQAARDFYGDMFGWDSSDAMDMGGNGEYRFLDFDGQRIGAIAGLSPGQLPAWRYYIGVASIDRAIGTIKDQGGQVVMGPYEVPGPMHIVVGKDPQGAEFALVGRK